MAKQFNWHLIENELRKQGVTVFSPQDLQHLFGASEIALRFLLTRAVKRGDAMKFRRALSGLAAHPPSELEIANYLYRPSYISFAFALSYHHLIPETVYSITSATTRTTATFTVLEKRFVYHRIKRAAFTGYTAERVNHRTVWIAGPEKALVDTLYFVALKKQGLPERINTTHLAKPKIRTFAKMFDYPELEETLEKVL